MNNRVLQFARGQHRHHDGQHKPPCASQHSRSDHIRLIPNPSLQAGPSLEKELEESMEDNIFDSYSPSSSAFSNSNQIYGTQGVHSPFFPSSGLSSSSSSIAPSSISAYTDDSDASSDLLDSNFTVRPEDWGTAPLVSGSREEEAPPDDECELKVIDMPIESRMEKKIKPQLLLLKKPRVHPQGITTVPTETEYKVEIATRTVKKYSWIRVPRSHGVKPDKIHPNEATVLNLSATVVCTGNESRRVTCCHKCLSRERRNRNKNATQFEPSSSAESSRSSNQSFHRSSFASSTSDDSISIIEFRGKELLEFGSGTTDLQFRITCYCRDHQTDGFQIIFELRDFTGRIVGRTTTDPILIADKHKSRLRALQKSKHDVEASAVPFPETRPSSAQLGGTQPPLSPESPRLLQQPSTYSMSLSGRYAREQNYVTNFCPSGIEEPHLQPPFLVRPWTVSSASFSLNPLHDFNLGYESFLSSPPPPPKICSISPIRGTSYGGEVLSLQVEGFHEILLSDFVIIFGTTVMRIVSQTGPPWDRHPVASDTAILENDTLMTCTTPRHSPGVVGVRLLARSAVNAATILDTGHQDITFIYDNYIVAASY